MPFVYNSVKAGGATHSTNATPSTDTDHLRFLTAASKTAQIQGIYIHGRGGALTSISGIGIRLVRAGTASTGGTAITPAPRVPTQPTAILTAFSDTTAITAGATPTQALVFGCGAAGPGGWVAPDADSKIALDANGGANGNVDLISACATASLPFTATVEHAE